MHYLVRTTQTRKYIRNRNRQESNLGEAGEDNCSYDIEERNMAVSTTTATVYIPSKSFPNQSKNYRCIPSDSVAFGKKKRGSLIQSSTDASAETTTADGESEFESSIQVPKESSSLISALNVQRALRGIPITDADHYGRLGLKRGCSYQEVAAAYNVKVEEWMGQELEEEELNKKLELLKDSYTILSSEQERRIYDWSLARTDNPDSYVWPFEVDITQTPKGDPPPQEPEDVGPTRIVGYFFLGWIALSFVMNILLTR